MYEPLPKHSDAAPADRMERFRERAQRVIKELFNIDVKGSTINDETSLFDFAEDAADDPQFSRVWGECLKQEMFVRYGIMCEAHEPLVDVLARLDCAERGVRVVQLD
jgi:hypothetical protein